MRQCPFQCGERTAGSITKIRAAGFSGTAVTTWAGAVRMTSDKSNGGAPYAATSRRSKRIVLAVIPSAVRNNGRLCYTGLTIHEKYDETPVTNLHSSPRSAALCVGPGRRELAVARLSQKRLQGSRGGPARARRAR